jgi:hypothetical protein
VVLVACGRDEPSVVADSPVDAWEQLGSSPLPTRTRTVTAWTGDEVLVVGGDRFTCPPNADCAAPTEPPRRDGAVFDPATSTWRTIADAPVGFHAADVAVVGDVVYLLASTDYGGEPTFLGYDVATDTWSQPPAPPGAWLELVAAGDVLVAYTGSEEQGDTGDFAFDGATWSPLPVDPMTPAFDRSMVWAPPHLYLFDKENVPNPGSEQPAIVRAARLDLDAGTWEQLPDSEMIGGWDGWLVDGDRLINPLLGGADGGEVNGWGREVPNGGILGGLDDGDPTWSALPDGAPPPCDGCDAYGAGAFDDDSAIFFGTGGPVLDATTDTWITMPALEREESSEPAITAGGRDALAYVGDALWRWRAP